MPKKRHKLPEPKPDIRGWKDLSVEEVQCIICRNPLKEPITLDCRCTTRMRCTLCRVCLKTMADAEESTCRGECPQCRQRIMNWLSLLRKAGKTNYQDSVNLPLWAEIQKQFRPYNPNGKDPFQSDSPAKHQMAYKGEIWQEYEREKRNREAQFRKEKAEEEAANLALLKENPELKGILEEQAKVLEQIRVKKFQEEQSKSDAEFARKLQKEEEQKLPHRKIKKSPEKVSDAEFARRLQEELNRESLNGRPSDHKNSGFLGKCHSLPTKSPSRKKVKKTTPSKSKYSPVVHYSPSPPDENFFASRQLSPPNHDRTKQEEADHLFALKLSENEKYHARKIKLKNKNDTPKIDKFYRSYGVKRARVSSSDSDSSIYGLKATTSKSKKAIRINSSDDDDQTQLVHSGTTSKTSLLYYL